MVVDLDFTISGVSGKDKQGAGDGYTKKLVYHPLLATRADTGEVLHARMRKGAANTQRGTKRFIEELLPRLRRAGVTGELIMGFDSGFSSNATLATLEWMGVGYTMGVRMVSLVISAVDTIDEEFRTPIEYVHRSRRDRRVGVPGSAPPSCDAPGSSGARPRSGPSGDTSPSSPTWSATRSTSTPSTGPTPPSSWPSRT